MRKKILWLTISGMMAFSLVITSCGTTISTTSTATSTTQTTQIINVSSTTTQKPKEEAVTPAIESPKYGSTMRVCMTAEPRSSDPISKSSVDPTVSLINQPLWMGDWEKGPAGGYGTNESTWETPTVDNWDQNRGIVAETTKWSIDQAADKGTIVYTIRQGIHYALDSKNEASRLVNGREMTTDDVLFNLKLNITHPAAYLYLNNPELRTANLTKTGPWEITVKVPIDALISAISRFGGCWYMQAPEVVQKYHSNTALTENWKTSVGSGPFTLSEYIPGSVVINKRNPNYWEKDPIGPNKGNQLPYLDEVQFLILPDASTRMAALRTGKLDQMNSVLWDDAVSLRLTAGLIEAKGTGTGMTSVAMRVDQPPFNDLRVRRAMLMAIDWDTVHKSIAEGQGKLVTMPFSYTKGYEALYVDINDPDCPASVRENFSYNPDKSKDLLKEAGYPNGIKTTALLTSAQVDDVSIYKYYWDNVGVNVDFIVRENSVIINMKSKFQHPALVSVTGTPTATFYTAAQYTAISSENPYMVNEPFINKTLADVRSLAMTKGMNEAIKATRPVTKFILEQAYNINGVGGISSRFWWPWLKNYNGEVSVGYMKANLWATYVWIDQGSEKINGALANIGII